MKRLALITVCTIYASLLEMNGDIPDIQMNASVRKLENASTIDEINKHFCSCLFGMLDAKNKISTESYGYIQKAVQYIEQNYSQPITMPVSWESVPSI